MGVLSSCVLDPKEIRPGGTSLNWEAVNMGQSSGSCHLVNYRAKGKLLLFTDLSFPHLWNVVGQDV